jgi:predicted lipoprotein
MKRARPLRSAVAAGLLAVATFAACTDPRDRSPTSGAGSSGAVPTSPVARQALSALASCATTRTASFVPEAEALARAVDAWAALPSDASLRAKAKEAWLSAIFRWQTLEPWQFGPGAMSTPWRP